MSNYEDISRGVERGELGVSVFDEFYDGTAEVIKTKDAHTLTDHARHLAEAGYPTARFREMIWDSATLWQSGSKWVTVWGNKLHVLN